MWIILTVAKLLLGSVVIYVKLSCKLSEKAGLKLNIQKTKVMSSSLITSWQTDWEKWKQWKTLFSWAPKSLQMEIAAMKLKDLSLLKDKLWQI